MRFDLLGALALWLSLAGATFTAHAGESERCFRVFDATAYQAKPDLSRYGIEPAHVIYGVRQLWLNQRVPERLAALPGRLAVQDAIRKVPSGQSGPPLIVLEVEHWPNRGSDAEVSASIDKYVTLAEWAKADAGAGIVSFYGVPPLRDYWRAIQDPTAAEHRQWQAENDRFRRLAAVVDAFTPSLYTFYDDIDGWRRYAVANVEEARRLAQDKPVYPFIWPQYHNSNRRLDGRYLSGEFWTQQLRTLETVADGVVIRAGGPGAWQENAAWWAATRAFIESSGKVCRPRSEP